GSRPALEARATRAMAELDSVRALLGSNAHSLGRFRRDSTLVRDLRRIRADLDAARQLADSGNGTIGRLATDSALVRGLETTSTAVHRVLTAPVLTLLCRTLSFACTRPTPFARRQSDDCAPTVHWSTARESSATARLVLSPSSLPPRSRPPVRSVP